MDQGGQTIIFLMNLSGMILLNVVKDMMIVMVIVVHQNQSVMKISFGVWYLDAQNLHVPIQQMLTIRLLEYLGEEHLKMQENLAYRDF